MYNIVFIRMLTDIKVTWLHDTPITVAQIHIVSNNWEQERTVRARCLQAARGLFLFFRAPRRAELPINVQLWCSSDT